MGHHSVDGLIEIIHTQEEPNTTGYLTSDKGGLVVSVGLGEQNGRLTSRRTYDHPSFRSIIVRHRREILYQIESELFDEELNGRVLLVDDERHQL